MAGASLKNVELDFSTDLRQWVINYFMISIALRNHISLLQGKQRKTYQILKLNNIKIIRFAVDLLYEFSLSIVHYQAT